MTRESTLDPRRIEVPDPEMVRVLRAKTGAERIRIVCDMHTAARRMLRASLTARHPEWDEEQLQQEVMRRLLHGDG